jgi:hypothetical protein
MIERWCIVGDPRCGSHWLQSKLTPIASLDEFINYPMYADAQHDFIFDEDNFIQVANNAPTEPLSTKKFIQKRINQIKKMHLKQSIKGIMFCNNYDIEYPKIIQTLHERKFKFIFLERNMFDRVLSHTIVAITQFAHRWNGREGSPDSLDPITIDTGKWLESLFVAYQATEYRNKLFANNEYITVNYENLIEDCQIKGIPIRLKSDDILKTWNMDYKDIVTNIAELQIIYDSFIKMIPMYSGFLLKDDK